MIIFWYNIIIFVVILIVSYLFGSIPSGVIIGKIFFHQDPRDYGSCNMGGTNVSRLYGFKYGLLVYVFDFLKVAICIWGFWALLTFVNFDGRTLLPRKEILNTELRNEYIVRYPVYWICIIGGVLGHCFPIFAGFKGGKAAAVTFSSLILTSWFTGIVAISTFGITLKLSKYVSLSSIIGSILGAIFSWLTCINKINDIAMFGPTLSGGFFFGICATLASFILILRHRKNIIRILQKNERKIKWM